MEPDLTNPKQIKALINLLQGLLDNQEEAEDEPKVDKIKTKTRRAKNKSTQNKFCDMPEMNMHKNDSEIDKKLSKFPPTPRTRKFEPIKVKCRICGKTEKVNPAIVPDPVDRYKCNSCSSTPGA